MVLGTKDKATRAQMFREKVVNLYEAVVMLRASEAKLNIEKCCLSSKSW